MAPASDLGPRTPAAGRSVVVTGAASSLGRRVCTLASSDPEVARVVAVDRRPIRHVPASVETVAADLAADDLKPLLEGADVLVHLAQGDGPDRGSHPTAADPATGDARMAHRILDAASAVGITQVVLLSSATAYGAWSNNPVPLTEDAALRPNPGVAFAAEKAELERAAADWRDSHPGATVAILRPTVVLAPEGNGWLAKALARADAVPVAEDEPPAQFLDVDDLAAAVELARRARLDGPRNVAPDGWVDGDTARALAGAGPRVRLPQRVALRVAGWRWRTGLGDTPPALLPYTVHPWVIANDRLKADGWAPTSTNEETYVAHHRASPWATISPRRRQELALAGSGVAIAGVVAGAIALVRRRR
jgi:UDP-glucose 4-epimerase